MKKVLKGILSVVGIVLVLVILDTLQAKLFNNSPLVKVKEASDDALISEVNKGLLVTNYVCSDKTDKTVFRWSKYDCSDTKKVVEIVDTTKDKKDFTCDDNEEVFYDDGTYKYSYSCNKSKYVVVRYENGNEESVKDALEKGKITIDLLDKYKIDYIKTAKSSDLDCLKNLLGGFITTESASSKEVKLSNVISVSVKNVSYSYIGRSSAGIYVILKTEDDKVINALEKYLEKNYEGYTKAKSKDGYIIYAQNGINDFNLDEEIIACFK